MRSHQELAALAEDQYGVVSRRQLHALVYSDAEIDRACAAGRLHRLHRGAYAVGHVSLSNHGRCLAAVLACGPRAVLSGRSAGWLWDLLPSYGGSIDVTVSNRGHSRRGIRLHHAPALGAEDRARRARIPVTAIPRTLLDLAATLNRRQLDRAVERTEELGLFDLRAIEALLLRVRGHRGCGRLRRALAAYREPDFTRSGLERHFLELVERAGLPRPAVNTFVAGHELDAYWPAVRFAVELDTYDHHGGHAAFERDRIRQEDLKLSGIELTRITGARIEGEPKAVANRLRALLAQRQRELQGHQ